MHFPLFFLMYGWGGANGIMVIDAENGMGELSSKSSWSCLHLLYANALGESMNLSLLPVDKIIEQIGLTSLGERQLL